MEERTPAKELNSRTARFPTGAAGRLRLILFALLGSFLAGCGLYDQGETVNEERERAFQRGKQLVREGRHEEALTAFLRVIDRRPGDAAESHLEAGDIYLNRMEEPVEAIYHFRRYLDQAPNSPQADLVRGQIDRAMKELARTLPADPLRHPLERLDLLETVEDLEEENRRLRAEVASLREEREALTAGIEDANRRAEEAVRRAERNRTAQAAPESQRAERESNDSGSAETRSASDSPTETYTVRQGDSLYAISRRIYGTGSRWRDIYEANRDRLPDENSVRAGMTLRIPVD